MRDNVKSRVLQSDGSYVRPSLAEGDARHRSQEELMQLPGPSMPELPAPNGASHLLTGTPAGSG